jgi:hypothetical protein
MVFLGLSEAVVRTRRNLGSDPHRVTVLSESDSKKSVFTTPQIESLSLDNGCRFGFSLSISGFNRLC